MDYGIYLTLSFIGFFLALGASLFTSFVFNKYKTMPVSRDITPLAFAKEIVEREGLNVEVQSTTGQLSDHYDPRDNVIRLSSETAEISGLSQLTVAAHELGHALQDKHSGPLFATRMFLGGAVGLTTNIGYLLLIVGLTLSILNLAYVGLILFSTATIFMLLTLPIEIDASLRGLQLLKKYNILASDEMGAAQLVLTAAASTYFIAFLQTLVQFLYYASLISGRRRR